MEPRNYHDDIVEQLKMLNNKAERQSSIRRIFITGIIYGVGFFVGSAIIATIALGIFGPILGKIGWVQSSFKTGASILGR